MPRCRTGVLILLAVLLVPAICTAQELPSLYAIGSLNVGGVGIVPSLKVGYQSMAVNINVPVPFSGIFGLELATASTLDFKLQDAGVWIGGVRVDARRGGLSLFVTAEGNASKSARVSTQSDPFWAGFFPVYWRGSNLQWWSIDGGGAVDVSRDLAIIAGFKAEQLSLNLADPIDPTGVIRQFQAQFGDRYSSDFLTKLWVPYFGLRVEGFNSTGTLIISPYTWANVTIPFRYLFIDTPFFGYEDARYNFNNGGVLLEGDIDYRVQAFANVGCTLWLKGTWCQIRGQGYEGYQGAVTNLGNIVASFSSQASAAGSFSSYILAGGLSFLYTF